MTADVNKALAMLSETDDIAILLHCYPDGDTIGSGFALYRLLKALGKRARVICHDPIPPKYSYIYGGIEFEDFEPRFIVAVDVADTPLFGDSLMKYAQKIDLCIDHHKSNTGYAKNLLLDDSASAASEIIYDIIKTAEIPVSKDMANCIYTGIATDTGCFKYSNVTGKCHTIAAEMITYGIDFFCINREMFDVKSRARLEIERMALDTIEFFFDNKCAVMTISQAMIDKMGANEGDLEGLTPIPRQIEGVEIGVTMRERQDGKFKVSFRTSESFDASEFCALLGGGGHSRAAGCTVNGGIDAAKNTIIEKMKEYFAAGTPA